jgi:LmbE family N-acetylglucosaminyl deacetylase
MLTLDLGHARPPLSQVLCVGAHADDIEIGCGGTLLSLLDSCPSLSVTWVVFSADGARADEARRSSESFLARAANRQVQIHGFRDGFFPNEWARIKETIEQLKTGPAPDLVFTHYGADRHQDHRLVAELTWNTFRDHLVLEYEIPKYDGDLGSPNVFLPLDESHVGRKIEALIEHFPSQRSKRWFNEDLFRSLMRLRGMECNAAAGHAEAFYARKLVLT